MIPFALYIHIPFCRSRCSYCDFNTYLYDAPLAKNYLQALLKEARLQGVHIISRGYQPQTLYIGGGTPSILPAEILTRLFKEIQEIFPFPPGIEITLEANPKTLSASKLALIKKLGVNRLSLGVQSFDDTLLTLLKRAHSAQDARETYKLARQSGFANINLDFIFGLPGQSLSTWEKTLQEAVHLAPQHLSVYNLTLEPQAPLQQSLERGEIKLPTAKAEAEMFFFAHKFLESHGYPHYEISNYALNSYQSKHNWFYWHHQEYLGLGAGAHSYLGGRRYANARQPRDYIRLMEEKESAEEFSEVINREKAMEENLMLALRTAEGLKFEDFREKFGLCPEILWDTPLKAMEKEGLVQKTNKNFALTPQGLWMADEITARLLTFLP